METGRKEFISYDYKTVTADAERASFLLDGYENFGWEADENMFQNAGEAVTPGRQKKVTLRLKRNRKIINKMELTRLQRNFEACVGEIDTLERMKTSVPTEWALIIGILGTAFIAGSTFADPEVCASEMLYVHVSPAGSPV